VLINITGGSDLTLYEVNEASSLVQGAAHEEANIIFGAVIDDTMPEGEMRVTVIATGLDDGRLRKSPDPLAGFVERGNVMPLRRESPAASDRLPAAESRHAPQAEREPEPRREPEPSRAPAPAARPSDDWLSPYDDELDVPTFIRRGARAEGDEEEDREAPAFLRRSAD
jgi:cell division protein FtsZ